MPPKDSGGSVQSSKWAVNTAAGPAGLSCVSGSVDYASGSSVGMVSEEAGKIDHVVTHEHAHHDQVGPQCKQ